MRNSVSMKKIVIVGRSSEILSRNAAISLGYICFGGLDFISIYISEPFILAKRS